MWDTGKSELRQADSAPSTLQIPVLGLHSLMKKKKSQGPHLPVRIAVSTAAELNHSGIRLGWDCP